MASNWSWRYYLGPNKLVVRNVLELVPGITTVVDYSDSRINPSYHNVHSLIYRKYEQWVNTPTPESPS